MIEIEVAWDLLQSQSFPRKTETVCCVEAVGRRLAQPVVADLDSPPFCKSLMDGFAVRTADMKPGIELVVTGTSLAGGTEHSTLAPGSAIRIMTGAPVPQGADAVIMIEQCQVTNRPGKELVSFSTDTVSPGKHTMNRGQSMRAGQSVFESGRIIRSCDTGLLAETGHATVEVFCRPSVTVLATGDELVPCDQIPSGDKIRNSNGPMLAALARNHTGRVGLPGIAPDNRDGLRSMMLKGLESDVLVLSGGVSAGVADLVPGVLQELGVKRIFHKVALKPGKPVWYGVHDRDGKVVHVFGLPGNPVSSLVCFQLFVRPCLERLSGSDDPVRPKTYSGVLSVEHATRGGRPTWWPIRQSIGESDCRAMLEPLVWHGSSDLRCLADANALALFAPKDHPWPAGTVLPWLPLDGRM